MLSGRQQKAPKYIERFLLVWCLADHARRDGAGWRLSNLQAGARRHLESCSAIRTAREHAKAVARPSVAFLEDVVASSSEVKLVSFPRQVSRLVTWREQLQRGGNRALKQAPQPRDPSAAGGKKRRPCGPHACSSSPASSLRLLWVS